MTGNANHLAPAELGRIQHAIDELATFRSPQDPGWTRRVFSDPFVASREVVARRMRQAGLDVHCDGVGNIVGVLPGRVASAPALVTGSHTDTVHGGGRYDGVVGVLGAIEAVHILQASGVELGHELRIVDFVGEEPNEFGSSCLGSRAIAGALRPQHLARSSPEGGTLGDAFAAMGTTGHDVLTARWARGSVAAYVELHIEQGPVLDQAGAAVGVVSSIVSVARAHVEFIGRRDHAGTMPMAARHDACAAAAHAMVMWEDLARQDGTSVITTGSITLEPGAVNVVPEFVKLLVEVRSATTHRCESLQTGMEEMARSAAAHRGVRHEFGWLSREPSIVTDAAVATTIGQSVRERGHEPIPVVSGAEHDAVHLAALAPMGMIFVRSRGGRSHCPEEWTDIEDIGVAVDVLARTLVRLDAI